MILPKELEVLRSRKIWLCYPMIYNPKKHNGVGGYDKPPISAYTLYNGSSNDPASLSTYDEAAAQIGKAAHVKTKDRDDLLECKVAGVGIAFSGTGLFGVDLDNVVDLERRVMTFEAGEIMKAISSYTEISPSGTGLHIIAEGKLPEVRSKLADGKEDFLHSSDKKGEYQLFDSGYMAISGNVIGVYDLAERTQRIAEVYERYFESVEPIEKLSTQRPANTSSVVSSSTGFTYERWLEDVRRLSDAEILERIFSSGDTGRRVRALYDGDTSAYGNDHSRADQALVTYLYGFTNDRNMTERLFRTSQLYRSKGKSRSYLDRTLNKAAQECKQLVGHIEFTAGEKKAYAQKKEAEERSIKMASRKENYSEWLKKRAERR